MDRVAVSLEKIIADALHRVPEADSPLLAWPVVCGSAVAGRTRALSFAEGILSIEVADAGWQRELAALAPRYLPAINRYSSVDVRRIEFVVKA